MRLWDQASAARVDYFAANSHNVAARVRKYYRREAEVIHPPVDVCGAPFSNNTGDYYLMVGQLVNYKRVDLAIAACNRLGRELRIVGAGEEYERLRRMAGATVKFFRSLSDYEVREQYARCRALLFPGEEDFGLVPVEAQACGRPVIAFGKGGARETVIGAHHGEFADPGRSTGMFFAEPSLDSLVDTILNFEAMEHRFSPSFIRAHAEQFDKKHFVAKMERFVSEKLEEFAPSSTESFRPSLAETKTRG
jgi:glycosyltransferase involved in cell wall biosynthesis